MQFLEALGGHIRAAESEYRNLTLEQIAAQVGYSSYNGFYSAVRQYYELSPQELRARLW